MADLVIGLGEIGFPILQILDENGIDVYSYDIKCESSVIPKEIEVMHICIPYTLDFEKIVREYQERFKPKYTIIHSTVKPGTSDKLNAIYSPVRGMHGNMKEDIKYYTKYYVGSIPHDMMVDRFRKVKRKNDKADLERAKIIATTLYGWNIAFRKMIDNRYPDQYWDFMGNEVKERIPNYIPVMYNDRMPIGGHCVIPNLKLIDFPEITDVIDQFG